MSDAPRCPISGHIVTWIPRDAWVGDETTVTCKAAGGCGQQVRFRVRVTDLPGHARILPHRTDGSPCR